MAYRFALILAAFLCAPLCLAAPTSATGTITVLREPTTLQPVGSVQNVTLFTDYQTEAGEDRFFAQSVSAGIRISY